MARVGSMVAQVVGQGHRAAAAAATVAARVHGSRALSVAPPAAAAAAAAATSPAAAEAPVGIVMLNMGGPGSLHDPHTGVQAFLGRLFGDPEIIRLGPLQRVLGPWIAKRRTPKIVAQYEAIGGKSPIGEWTAAQGAGLVRALGAQAATAGRVFKTYTAFRYAPPLTAEALVAMHTDGVRRAVAFSQYPQYSCTTTGSSLNHLWREALRLGLGDAFEWTVIDRWHNHPVYIAALARRVALGLAALPAEVRDTAAIVFSAHSVPSMIVNRGDPYVPEVAATVDAVMSALRRGVPLGDGTTGGGGEGGAVVHAAANPHVLAWQSKVGVLPWMGPSTASVLAGLGKQGVRAVLMVPVAFTSDHIETLYEIDVEYRHAATTAGIRHFGRAPSLNDEPLLPTAMAALVADALAPGAPAASPEYGLRCAGCTNDTCRSILNPATPYSRTTLTPGAGEWPTPAVAAALAAAPGPTP